VRRDDGWVPVDLTLERTEDGYRPQASVADVLVSAGGDGPVATLTEAGEAVSVGWPVRLPAPTVSGPVATYDLGNSMQLRVTVTHTGFRQHLVLLQRPEVAPVLRVPLALQGLAITEEPDGALAMNDAKGKARMRMEPPTMWGAEVEPLTGEPLKVAKVTSSVEKTRGGPQLVLSPAASFLNDPAVTYPLVVDPDVSSVGRVRDTYVGSNAPTTSHGTDYRLHAGYNGTGKYRSYLQYDTPVLPSGAYIVSSTLTVYQYNALSCTPTPINAYPATAAWTTGMTWNTQPTITTSSSYSATATFAHGIEGQCANASDTIDLTKMVKAWHAGTISNYGLTLRASETDSNHFKSLCSMNQESADPGTTCSYASRNPTLSVTYNRAPATPSSRLVEPSSGWDTPPTTTSTNTTTPRLRAKSCDPDGDLVRLDFEVWNSAKTTKLAGSPTTGQPATTSCAYGYWTVPAGVLANGGVYHFRVRGYDGDTSSAWSGWLEIRVDTAAPAAPSVSSTTYPAGQWSGADGQSGSFTLGAAGSADVTGYYYGLDDPLPSELVVPTAPGGSSTVSLAPAEGRHTLSVRSRDKAGNLSAISGYTFSVGGGALTAPEPDARTDRYLTVSAEARTTWTGGRYQWRRADTDTWADIPAGWVTLAGGGAVSWPLAVTGGVVPEVTWDVKNTVGATDGPVQIRVHLTDTGSGVYDSVTRRLTLDQVASSAATTPIGPGVVNLRTGAYMLAETDVTVSSYGTDLSVGRSYNSRATSIGTGGPFGAPWDASFSVDNADSDFEAVSVAGSLVTVQLPGNETITFTEETVTTSTKTYTAEDGAEYLMLTLDRSADRFQLADLDGNVTIFAKLAGATTYTPAEIRQPGSAQTTSYAYELVGSTPRVTRIVAPQPAGVSCTTAPLTTRGCRSLTLRHAAANTPPPGDAPTTWGPYANRLIGVDLTAWDPATAAMRTVALGEYAYDSAGRLRAAWDPRLPNLKTSYGYDAAGHVTAISPPGEEPWAIGYGPTAADPETGRLQTVSRASLVPATPTATTTMVYNVPRSGSGAPYNLSTSEQDRWGQTSRPVEAVAVFPPDQVPPPGPPNDYSRAVVHYLDINGRETNTANPGGRIDATDYDEQGNPVRELTAGNRWLALNTGATDSPAAEAALAERLSTRRVYQADGLQLADEFGPEHDVQLAGGDIVRARAHTHNNYDEGAPTGGPFHLVTSSTMSARVDGETTDRASETRTSETKYDWTLRRPTETVADPGTGKLNRRELAAYDATTGLLTSSTLPGANGATNTAQTLVTTFYSTAANSTHPECGGRPEWANLACRTDPAAQPAVSTDRPAIPATRYTYTLFNTTDVETHVVGSTVLRTTDTDYDSAGRVDTVSSATPGVIGDTELPVQKTLYDPNTGQAVETQTLNGQTVTARIVRSYDTLGRLVSYTDADGNAATTNYDLLGRPLTTNDGKGSRTSAYNPRGELAQLDDSHAGTFTATYYQAGRLTSQTYPGGLVATTGYDETDTPVSLDYDKAGAAWLSFTVTESIHGQWLTHAGSLSAQAYTYDAAGRLARVQDTPVPVADATNPGCTTRSYTLDLNSNRTSQSNYNPGTGGACQTTTPASSATASYDTADRITDSGYVYDALGRTTATPASAGGPPRLTTGTTYRAA